MNYFSVNQDLYSHFYDAQRCYKPFSWLAHFPIRISHLNIQTGLTEKGMQQTLKFLGIHVEALIGRHMMHTF